MKEYKDLPRSLNQNILTLLRDIELTPQEIAEETKTSIRHTRTALASLLEYGVIVKLDNDRYTSNYEKMSIRVYQSEYDQLDYIIPVSKIQPKRNSFDSMFFSKPKFSYYVRELNDGSIEELECGVLQDLGDELEITFGEDSIIVPKDKVIWQ